jgi:hypothetical protein
MTTLLLAQLVVAADLKQLISQTFFRAYYSHVNGMSLDELLIDYDIEAAGTTHLSSAIANATRTTIKAAVMAVDRGVPYQDAHDYLMSNLEKRISKFLQKEPPQHAMGAHK